MENPSLSPSVRWVLLSLPNELLEQILLSPSLCVPDLCRVRRVCWHLRNVVDRLWTEVAMSRLAPWQAEGGDVTVSLLFHLRLSFESQNFVVGYPMHVKTMR